MKFTTSTLLAASLATTAFAFAPQQGKKNLQQNQKLTELHVLAEPPKEQKKLAKIETLKINSNHLLDPLKEVRYIYN
jgi:hypothetical protein